MKKIFSITKTIAQTSFAILISVLAFGFEIQLFWIGLNRLLNWTIDGNLPQSTFWLSLVYGSKKIDSDPYYWVNIYDSLFESWYRGLGALLAVCIFHIILYLNYEWVIRDAGFEKLIHLSIGDLFIQGINNMNNNHVNNEVDPMVALTNVNNLIRIARIGVNAARDEVQIQELQNLLRALELRRDQLQIQVRNMQPQQAVDDNEFDNLFDEPDSDPEFIPNDFDGSSEEEDEEFDEDEEDNLELELDEDGYYFPCDINEHGVLVLYPRVEITDENRRQYVQLERQYRLRCLDGREQTLIELVRDRVMDKARQMRLYGRFIPSEYLDNKILEFLRIDRAAITDQELDATVLEIYNNARNIDPSMAPDFDRILPQDEQPRPARNHRVREERNHRAREERNQRIRNQVPDFVDLPRPIGMDNRFPRANQLPPIRPAPVAGVAGPAPGPAPAQGAAIPGPAVAQEPFANDFVQMFYSSFILAFLAVNLVILSYQATFYFIPLSIMNIIYSMIRFMLTRVNFFNLVKHKLLDFNDIFYLRQYLILPIFQLVENLLTKEESFTTFERFFSLFLFYATIYSGLLYILHKGKKQYKTTNIPINGTFRKIYLVIFKFVATVKVTTIFSIELLFFPAYCGFLIELVTTPVFTYDHYFALSMFKIFDDYLILRFFAYWGIGTFFMCLFAIYIGMTRTHILRQGVLFFIRSPDDANARLVHDALVRSFTLQLSRIGMSGGVYTAFVLFGIGLVPHLLKLSGSNLLPLTYERRYLFLLFTPGFFKFSKSEVLKKYLRKYWKRAFKICAAKTRLSSFLLKNNKPTERGHVIYRNLFTRIFVNCKPNYDDPKTTEEALNLFKTTDAKCFFIPDGSYVRAPSNDIVSRKYVREMFIPVTKDDIPLGIEVKQNQSPLDEFDDSEHELVVTNSYELVYRPPMFGFRIFLFIAMLWVFGCILYGGFLFLSNFIGLMVKLLPHLSLEKPVAKSFFQFSLVNTQAGALILCYAIEYFDGLLSSIGNESTAESNTVLTKIAKEVKNQVRVQLVNRVSILSFDVVLRYLETVFCLVSLGFWMQVELAWFFYINMWGVQIPSIYPKEYEFVTAERMIEEGSWDKGLNLNLKTYVLHAILVLCFSRSSIIGKRIRRSISETLRMEQPVVEVEGHAEENTQLGHRLKNLIREDVIPVLTEVIPTFGFHTLLKLGLSTWEYYKHPQLYTSYMAAVRYVAVDQRLHRELIVKAAPVLILLFYTTFFFIKFSKIFQSINAQVKEEVYAKGKRLTNSED